MKNGAPIIAVTTPIGISAGLIKVRDIISAKTNKIAPASAEQISKALCLGPINKRIICGIINPTKPIIPDRATLTPTQSAINNISCLVIFLTSNPKCLASDSPNNNASNA